MQLLRNVVCLTILIGTASLALAVESPFAGTWKLNPSKSKLAGDTVKFAAAGDGMRMTAGGDSYGFKPDGMANKTDFGTAAWKKVDDRTWEETDMVKGRLDSTSTWALSPNGKTLTEHVTGDKPGGGRIDDLITFVRVTGKDGLAGTWKDREFKGNTPRLLVINDQDNGLTLEEPDFQLKAAARFDGKPGTVDGPTIPAGASFLMTSISARSFNMTRTQNGKPFDRGTWSVSADGKVLKVTTRTMGTTDPPFVEIFEKQ